MLPDEVLVSHSRGELERRKYADILRAYEAERRENVRLRERLTSAEEEARELSVQIGALRRRLQSDVATAREVGTIQAVRALLPVLDDLDRLVFHAELATDIQAVAEGFRLVRANFEKALQSLGVRAIPSVGNRFDPNLHEAVDRIESETHPENTVAEELQTAYEYKGTLIRPAKVRVAVRPSRPSQTEQVAE